MTAEPRPKARLQELDALRGLGALAVVIFHYSARFHDVFPKAQHVPFSFPGGNYRVYLFFAISGFAIFFTLDKVNPAADFAIARIARLYPTYWTAILLTLGVEFFVNVKSLEKIGRALCGVRGCQYG